MPNFTDITGLAGVASATAASLLLLPGIARLSGYRLAALLGVVFVLVLIPFSGLPLAAYVRGATGDLSITTLVLLVMRNVSWLAKTPHNPPCQGETASSSHDKGRLGGVFFRRCITLNYTRFSKTEGNSRFALLMPVALAALALYPMALGVSAFDPYRLGYGDPLFVTALLLVALAAWIRKYHLIASCIAFAILAWTAGWYESGNLWDYLLDPWIAIYALFAIARHGTGVFMQRGRL